MGIIIRKFIVTFTLGDDHKHKQSRFSELLEASDFSDCSDWGDAVEINIEEVKPDAIVVKQS